MEFRGIPCGFPFFDFQPLKTGHSFHLGTDSSMTTPGGATLVPWKPISFVGPETMY